MSIFVAPRPVQRSTAMPEKAAYGTGVNYYLQGDLPMSAVNQTPQDIMRRSMRLASQVPWIRAAERVITGLGSTVGWHLEDADDTEIDDQYPNFFAQQARQLIEKPQALLSIGQKFSRRELWALTLRHIGVCGNAFWLLDMPNIDGSPGAILYIRPDRMTPSADRAGNLTGWVLDADRQGNGTPLSLEDVVQFVIEPPDAGYFGMGLVESALIKASLSTAVDQYTLTKLQAGGRKTGILAPKAGIIDDDVYQQMIYDWRTASEANDAARRLQVVRAPVDFTDTGMDELTPLLRDLSTGMRDDLLGLWGVPASKLGLHDRGKGLGATAATAEDDETLWEAAVKPRLHCFTEPVQFEILDLWPLPIELELDTPDFGDDTPQFEKAFKAASQPLTNNQRLDILGLPPLPDYGPDGEPLGLAIYMPIAVQLVGQGPQGDGTFSKAPKPLPEPVVTLPPAPLGLPSGMPPAAMPAMKAKPFRNLAKLRASVERTTTPKLRQSVVAFLQEQKRDIAARLRARADHIASEPKDTAAWFDAKRWDSRLHAALKPHLARMAQAIAGHISEAMPAKAGPVDAVERALTRGAARVTGINQTTKDRIAQLIAEGIDNGRTVQDVADSLEEEAIFDDYRAELIARTELMDAYNGAAIGAYSDAGVTEVQAIDGDEDAECAERDGQTFSVEDADSIEDHPNGTLDWVPVLASLEAA